MAKKLTIDEITEPAEWDLFADESPQGTAFSHWPWLEAAAGAFGGRPVVLGVRQKDKLVAGVPFLSLKRGMFAKATTPPLTPYGGVLYRPDPGKRHSEAESFNHECAGLLAGYLESRYHQVFLVHSPGLVDVRPFRWRGWRETVRYTYTLDIRDRDALWDMLERRVRTVIRNARDSLELDDAVDRGTFIDLYTSLYRDRGVTPPFDPAAVEGMMENIMADGDARMRTARDADGTVLSAMICVHDDRRAYAWLSGSLPGKNASGAFSLLFWDAVEHYGGMVDELDMVGANIPSIAFFKKGFSGRLTPYFLTEYNRSAFHERAFALFTKLRNRFR